MYMYVWCILLNPRIYSVDNGPFNLKTGVVLYYAIRRLITE